MEKIELGLKGFELNFLQLMGINYINDEFVNVKDNTRFTCVDSESVDYDSGESGINYTFTDEKGTIIILRRDKLLKGNENSVVIQRGGYQYCIEGENDICALFLQIKNLNDNLPYGFSMSIREENNDPKYVSTITVNECSFGLRMLCSKDKLYPCAILRGDKVEKFGDEYDYSTERYTKILEEEIKELEDSEYQDFFMKMLPTIVETHESVMEPDFKVVRVSDDQFDVIIENDDYIDIYTFGEYHSYWDKCIIHPNVYVANGRGWRIQGLDRTDRKTGIRYELNADPVITSFDGHSDYRVKVYKPDGSEYKRTLVIGGSDYYKDGYVQQDCCVTPEGEVRDAICKPRDNGLKDYIHNADKDFEGTNAVFQAFYDFSKKYYAFGKYDDDRYMYEEPTLERLIGEKKLEYDMKYDYFLNITKFAILQDDNYSYVKKLHKWDIRDLESRTNEETQN